MPVIPVTVTEAHAALCDGGVCIDVRSRAEFAAGRPSGAINVPLQDHDDETGQLWTNPDFVRVMQANFPSDTQLLMLCESGNRSARAAQMLEAFGFTTVATIVGGFEAWKPLALPIETSPPVTHAYSQLLAAADALSE